MPLRPDSVRPGCESKELGEEFITTDGKMTYIKFERRHRPIFRTPEKSSLVTCPINFGKVEVTLTASDTHAPRRPCVLRAQTPDKAMPKD